MSSYSKLVTKKTHWIRKDAVVYIRETTREKEDCRPEEGRYLSSVRLDLKGGHSVTLRGEAAKSFWEMYFDLKYGDDIIIKIQVEEEMGEGIQVEEEMGEGM